MLRLLASKAGPVSAAAVAKELDLPRSTSYHLLNELVTAGFVTHITEERRYGLGLAAFELGSAYLRHDPLERLAKPVLRRLVERTGRTVHLGVLHGSETLYLLREQTTNPHPTVTEVGVRLPAQLPASGRAMLARLPPAQVRALFPARHGFVTRTGRGPADLPSLRRLLNADRRRGWSVEDGHVTVGFASVAVAVLGREGRPIAAISCTFRHECPGARECGQTWTELAAQTRRAADELTVRVGGHVPA